MIRPRLLATPIDGYTLPSSYSVQRCPSESYKRTPGEGRDGWSKVRGCGLAFAFKLKSGDLVESVHCPGCGAGLTTSTRRLSQGFLVLTEADVQAIQDASGYTQARPYILAAKRASGRLPWEQRRQAERAAWAGVKGVPVAVSVLEPAPDPLDPNADFGAVAGVQAEEHLPPAERIDAPAKSAKLVAAEEALAKFDAKPRCQVCWGYNPSPLKYASCSFCREYKQQPADQTAQGERDQYTWNRGDLVARVVKAGGVPAPAPVAGYDAHIAERNARKAAERARRVAEVEAMRARGRRP